MSASNPNDREPAEPPFPFEQLDENIRAQIAPLAILARSYQDQIDGIDATRKLVVDRINELADQLQLPRRVASNNDDMGKFELRKTKGGGGERIVKEKLLEAGVTMKQIKAATTTVKSWEKWVVLEWPPKQKKQTRTTNENETTGKDEHSD